MGIDFIRKRARWFRKGLDKRRVELGTPGLFSRALESVPRSYVASVGTGESITLGEELCVCLKGDQLVALRGIRQVACFSAPPPELLNGLTASFGEACGKVEVVHEIASVVEISIC